MENPVLVADPSRERAVSAAVMLSNACSETLVLLTAMHPDLAPSDVVNGVMTLMRKTIQSVMLGCEPAMREHNREQFRQGLMQLMMDTLEGSEPNG